MIFFINKMTKNFEVYVLSWVGEIEPLRVSTWIFGPVILFCFRIFISSYEKSSLFCHATQITAKMGLNNIFTKVYNTDAPDWRTHSTTRQPRQLRPTDQWWAGRAWTRITVGRRVGPVDRLSRVPRPRPSPRLVVTSPNLSRTLKSRRKIVSERGQNSGDCDNDNNNNNNNNNSDNTLKRALFNPPKLD